MKRARFVAAARLEYLAEVVYYANEGPGLGLRFADAVEEAVARALAFPWPAPHMLQEPGASSWTDFLFPLSIDQREMEFLSSLWQITHVTRAIG